MKRFWMHVGVAAVTALVMGAVASACAHNNSSIFIRQVFAPPTPSNGSCAYTADITQTSISVGNADVSFPGLETYSPEVLVGNQIITQANLNSLQTETSRVTITGAITRITDLAGDTSLIDLFASMCKGGASDGDPAACTTGKELESGAIATPINPFSTVENTTIEPGTGTSANYGALALTMIDGATVSAIRRYFENSLALGTGAAFSTSIQLISYTKVEGVTSGNDYEESNEFEFAVTFTYGGLVSNLASYSGSAYGYCLDTAITVPDTLQTCIPGQDVPSIVGFLSPLSACPHADAGTTVTDSGT